MQRLCAIVIFLPISLSVQVTTSQYNNARTAATLNEKILTPGNVNTKTFGKLGAFKVDSPAYSQPLFLPNVEVPGKGTNDVIYVATELDTTPAPTNSSSICMLSRSLRVSRSSEARN